MRAHQTLLLALLTAGPAAAQTVAPRPGAPATPVPRAVKPAHDVAAAERSLRAWFAGYELVPDEARFRSLGPALGPALRHLAADPANDLLLRARAVSALAFAPGPETTAALRALLDDAGTPSLLRRKAVLVLGDVGAGQLDRIVAAFEAAADDVPLREACARALRALGRDAWAARATLIAGEKAPTVLALLRDDKQITPGRPE